jgi:uncharacterized protein
VINNLKKEYVMANAEYKILEAIQQTIKTHDIPGMARDETVEWEKIHSVSSARTGARLAVSRGVNPLLALSACALHDLGRIINGKQDGHAQAGCQPAKELLRKITADDGVTPLFSDGDIAQIAEAVKNHSKKDEIGSPLDEIVKDADLIDMAVFGAPFSREAQRVRFERINDDQSALFREN